MYKILSTLFILCQPYSYNCQDSLCSKYTTFNLGANYNCKSLLNQDGSFVLTYFDTNNVVIGFTKYNSTTFLYEETINLESFARHKKFNLNTRHLEVFAYKSLLIPKGITVNFFANGDVREEYVGFLRPEGRNIVYNEFGQIIFDVCVIDQLYTGFGYSVNDDGEVKKYFLDEFGTGDVVTYDREGEIREIREFKNGTLNGSIFTFIDNVIVSIVRHGRDGNPEIIFKVKK